MKNINSNSQDKTELGQIFTGTTVAVYMIDMLLPYITEKSTILDPCIGNNIFFEELSTKATCDMTGVEIDSDLLTEKIVSFFDRPNRKLIQGNFFDFEDEKFDYIIMNPPYVRQELLNKAINSKKKISKSIPGIFNILPKKSNLYVYFLIKALQHLKPEGKLIAIIYDSWLFTEFGVYFKEYLTNNFNIIKIIHLRNNAFRNAVVGATIVEISKKSQQKEISYVCVNSPKELSSKLNFKKILTSDLLNFPRNHNSLVDFNSDIFRLLSTISTKPISRGVSAKANRYFIFSENRFPPHTTKILKSVTKIDSFTADENHEYILKIKGEVQLKLKKYLDSIKKEIIESKKNKVLKDEILKGNPWYIINGETNGNIIFNYYMRDNVHFILNPEQYLVSDNFYSLDISEDIYAYLAVLNSSFTVYSLLKMSKSQGRGLFKIQLNKFRKVPILDVNKIDKDTKDKLDILGYQLSKTKRANSNNIINRIDSIILREMNRLLQINLDIKTLQNHIDEIRGGMK